jgi:hypothetical protein
MLKKHRPFPTGLLYIRIARNIDCSTQHACTPAGDAMRRKLSKPKVVPVAGASTNVGRVTVPVRQMDSGLMQFVSTS